MVGAYCGLCFWHVPDSGCKQPLLDGARKVKGDKKMKQKRITFLLPIVMFLVIGLVGCSPAAAASDENAVASPPADPAPRTATSATDLLVELTADGSLEAIYDRVNPSVVHIQVTKQTSTEALSLFQFPNIPGFPNITPQLPDSTMRSEGSGFVWDAQGHVVTNNHVVADAEKITVIFADDVSVDATLIGTDPDSDLAVLSVDAPDSELHPVQVADSAQLHVGDLAVAIGTPFGQQGTMTVGIISALGRLLPVDTSDPAAPRYNIPDVIQTDASINPGNSGGVLLNDQGQVVGVTSAIISPAGASAGVGFAIPSAIVQQVIPVLISDGHYDHPYLGISGVSLTPELAEAAGLKADQMGALIGEVVPDSPADAAHLQGSDRQVEVDGRQTVVGGDVIIAIDKQPVRNMDDLITYIYRFGKVGEKVSLTILRDEKEQTVEVTLQARPQAEDQMSDRVSAVQETNTQAWLGITGITVNSELANAMGLDQDQKGVLIEQVELGSPADDAGLHGSFKPVMINGNRIQVGGDIIVTAAGEDIQTMQDLQRLLARSKPGEKVDLTVLRDGQMQEITLTLGEQSS